MRKKRWTTGSGVVETAGDDVEIIDGRQMNTYAVVDLRVCIQALGSMYRVAEDHRHQSLSSIELETLR